jgi:hypothetical protein
MDTEIRKWKLIYWALVLSAACAIVIYFQPHSCEYYLQFLNKTEHSVIVDKYNTSRVIALVVKENDSLMKKYQFDYGGRLAEHAEIGDSIIKRKGSLYYQLVKEDTILFFPYANWPKECDVMLQKYKY